MMEGGMESMQIISIPDLLVFLPFQLDPGFHFYQGSLVAPTNGEYMNQ